MQQRSTSNLPGIDISHYETGINYDDIVAQGKKVVYLKASEGSTGAAERDSTLPVHNAACRARGLATAPYHVVHFYPASTIADQLANFLGAITGQAFRCLPAIDVEPTSFHGVNAAEATAQLLDLAARIKSAVGAAPIVYADTSRIRDNFTAAINQLLLWIADYRTPEAGPGENGKTESWTGFQYSESGSIGGKTVDLDEFIPAIIIPEWCYGAPAEAPQSVAANIPAAGDPAVRAYQHKLNVLKIRDDNGQPIAEDGVNGPRTKQGVVRLEELMGLTVDSGIWGKQCENTYASLIGAKPTLQQGSRGNYVKYLQYLLGGLTIDGIFGAGTLAAVKKYQSAHGLKSDGIVGTQTWGALL